MTTDRRRLLAAATPRLVAALEIQLICRGVLHAGRRLRRVLARPLGIAGAGHRAVPRRLVELPRAAVLPAGADRSVVAVALDLERAVLEAGKVAAAPGSCG